MKFFLIALLGLLTISSAMAAPKSSKINKRAYAILVKNLDSLTNQDGVSLASFISEDLKNANAGDKSYKITNKCTFDLNDQQFNCELEIQNSSDGLESLKKVNYQLEKGENGLPSNFFFLTVNTMLAG